ncbi:MAG: AbrB/MazE/SpoVT family DNA-binding domain-containing protein [Pirellulales bacterium]
MLIYAKTKKSLVHPGFVWVQPKIRASPHAPSKRLTSFTPVMTKVYQWYTFLEVAFVIKNLVKHGNSWALVIDKPILELLNFDPEHPLEITTDGQTLVISPAKPTERQAKFKAALDKTNRRYGKALKKLAE